MNIPGVQNVESMWQKCDQRSTLSQFPPFLKNTTVFIVDVQGRDSQIDKLDVISVHQVETLNRKGHPRVDAEIDYYNGWDGSEKKTE